MVSVTHLSSDFVILCVNGHNFVRFFVLQNNNSYILVVHTIRGFVEYKTSYKKKDEEPS